MSTSAARVTRPVKPPVWDPSRPVHSFDFVTMSNGPECSRCGTYRWGSDGEQCGVPVNLADNLAARWCTDCGVQLPKYLLNGSLDTFPRCSRHAF